MSDTGVSLTAWSLAALSQLGDGLRAAWVPMTLTTGLILAGAWLVDRALARRVSAAWRLLPYGVVLVRLLLPAGWQSPLGLFPGSAGPPPVAPGEPVFVLVDAAVVPAAPTWGPGAWLGLAYAAGVLALLARFAVARWRLHRQLRGATPLPLRAEGTPVWRHPMLGPCVVGVWRPRILLPATLVDPVADPEQEQARAFILRHEQAHVRRRDPLLALLLQLACCLAWPVLPLWIASRRIRSLMEEACDERAVAGADGAARRRYGELLLALAEGRLPGPLGHALGFPALGSPLRARLRALGNQRRWPVALQGAAAAVLAAVALACGGESDGDVDAPFDGGDASYPGSAALRLDPAVGPGPSPDDVFSAPGYAPMGRLGKTPATVEPPRLLPSRLALAPELKSTWIRKATPEEVQAAVSASETRARRLRQTAPWVRLEWDATWLCSARAGCSRMGAWKPLDTAIREALEHTGSRALLVDAHQSIPYRRVEEVLAAAKRAGAEELAVSLAPAPSWPQSPSKLPSLQPGAAPVPYSHRDPILSVTASGDLYLWNERVTPAELEDQLRGWLTHSPSNRLLIRGDKQAMNRSAADIMAIAKRAGIANIGILSGPPMVTAGPAAKQGSLDKEIIRGIIRDHIHEVKACYEAQLRKPPFPGGTVRVQFTIGPTGTVDESALADTTMNDALVIDCLVEAIRTWKFPAPEGGGGVVVDFPFLFQPRPETSAAATD
jgi:biopolymer transport protein ExbD/Zn-dependent protease with chaperone function